MMAPDLAPSSLFIKVDRGLASTTGSPASVKRKRESQQPGAVLAAGADAADTRR